MNLWEPKALMSYWEENIKHDQRGTVCVIIWPIVFKECHTNTANYAERLNYVIPIQQLRMKINCKRNFGDKTRYKKVLINQLE